LVFGESFPVEKNIIKFKFGTEYRWITGHVSTMHRRLIDILNTEHTDAIVAEGVSSYSLAEAATGEVVDYANITTASILFAVPVEEVRDAPRPKDPFVWVKKRPERVRVGTGPFNIEGNVYLAEEYKLKDLLLSVRDQFIAVAQAVVTRADAPEFREEHGVVFVNRSGMDFIMPTPSASSGQDRA